MHGDYLVGASKFIQFCEFSSHAFMNCIPYFDVTAYKNRKFTQQLSYQLYLNIRSLIFIRRLKGVFNLGKRSRTFVTLILILRKRTNDQEDDLVRQRLIQHLQF